MISIPHSRPAFGQPYIDAAIDVIQSGQLACGENTHQLEQHISSLLNIEHVLAVDSGTSALTLAIRTLTRGKLNARIGIPAYACASLLFAVKATGAQPVLMDCNDSLTLAIPQAMETIKTLDVLILVHPFGLVEPLAATTLACPTIEDIAQSVGATLNSRLVGTFGDMCIGSLYATKPWGGAYGGFISSNKSEYIDSCRTMTNPDDANLNTVYVGHHQLSNVHATLANQRMLHAAQEQELRQKWALQFDALCASVAATPIKSAVNSTSNAFRYIVRCQSDADIVIQRFHALGIAASKPVAQPLHHSHNALCPQADLAWKHCVSLPLLCDLAPQEFDRMQQGIQTCFNS